MMKRRSRGNVVYAVPDEADDDEEFVQGKANREKNNNLVKKASKRKSDASAGRNGRDDDEEEDEDDDGNEYERVIEECSDDDDDFGSSEPRTLTTGLDIRHSSSSQNLFKSPPPVSAVKKGPKKLILKKKARTKADEKCGDEDEDRENRHSGAKSKINTNNDRHSGETVTLVRGVRDRKFVLFKSDNFKFSVNKKGSGKKDDLVHHFSYMEANGPAVLPPSLLIRPLLNSIRPLRVNHSLDVFDRRVTAIEWHPTLANKVAVGSKGGEITLLDIAKPDPTEDAVFLSGVGAGGCIGAMRFCPTAPQWLLTSCLNSTVELKNLLNPAKTKVLHDTGDWNKWFVSCDLNTSLYAAGQSTGILQLFDRNSLDIVVEQKIHKGKITHVEFSKHHEYLLASASAVGHDVKIWDLRKMKNAKNEPSPLNMLAHDAGVNVASFSGFNGQRLLTSDQYGQIRVYALPGFYLERSILHPHRQFQHLTPIKASWHPLQDLIVIGRWPDPDFVGYSANEKRTIDIFDANTGSLSLQLFDASLGGIISLNKFSNDGQFLCSGMSRKVLLWRPSADRDTDATEAHMEGILCGDLIGSGGDGKKKAKKRQPPKGKQTKDKKDSDVKIKVKTVETTKSKGKKGGKNLKDDDEDD